MLSFGFFRDLSGGVAAGVSPSVAVLTLALAGRSCSSSFAHGKQSEEEEEGEEGEEEEEEEEEEEKKKKKKREKKRKRKREKRERRGEK